ncbi:MAG TPA: hypothetical protein VLD37_01265 [Candidatus Bilamarchaeum sp.]|nr:hypothetical protein [Candidatus Bilamarchaeum sp.]
MDERRIAQISDDATSGRITFNEALRLLREQGVQGYRVDVNTHSKIFFDAKNTFLKKEEADTALSPAFDWNRVNDALRQMREGSLTFDEFLARLGAAGVCELLVDIIGRRVFYLGLYENYVEPIPA